MSFQLRSMLRWTLIACLLATHLHITYSHHVIFESVGQMVNSLNYIHCKFTLNLSSISEQHQKYHNALDSIVKNLSQPAQPYYIPTTPYEPELSMMIKSNYEQMQSTLLNLPTCSKLSYLTSLMEMMYTSFSMFPWCLKTVFLDYSDFTLSHFHYPRLTP